MWWAGVSAQLYSAQTHREYGACSAGPRHLTRQLQQAHAQGHHVGHVNVVLHSHHTQLGRQVHAWLWVSKQVVAQGEEFELGFWSYEYAWRAVESIELMHVKRETEP